MRIAPMLLAGLLAASPAAAVTVFSTDFSAGLPDEFAAFGAAIEVVQGYDGLGHPGNQFGGTFLRYSSNDVVDTTLTLTDLPPHDTLSLGFLLGLIDSWDGVELLEVTVDGALLFSNWFQLATGDDSSYVAPPGALLSSGTDLGFSLGGYYARDRAYDLSLEPAFAAIPHTADTATITWRLVATPGGGASFWQGGADESWAIDNVRVDVSNDPPTTTTTLASTTSTTTLATTTTTSVSTTTTTTAPPATTTTTTTPATTTTTLPAGLLSAKKLLLKWTDGKPDKTSLNLLSKDPGIDLGDGPGSADDPTIAGGSLRVFAAGGDGFDDTYDLPASNWRYRAKKKPEKGYRFGKASPVKNVEVRPGKEIKLRAQGSALGHSLAADPQPVLVELRLGAARYCFGFGGTVTFTPGKKLLAKDASAADAACPP